MSKEKSTEKRGEVDDAWRGMDVGKRLMAKVPGVLDVLDVISCQFNINKKTWFFKAMCLIQESKFVMGEVDKGTRIDEVIVEFTSEGVLKAVKIGSRVHKPPHERVL